MCVCARVRACVRACVRKANKWERGLRQIQSGIEKLVPNKQVAADAKQSCHDNLPTNLGGPKEPGNVHFSWHFADETLWVTRSALHRCLKLLKTQWQSGSALDYVSVRHLLKNCLGSALGQGHSGDSCSKGIIFRTKYFCNSLSCCTSEITKINDTLGTQFGDGDRITSSFVFSGANLRTYFDIVWKNINAGHVLVEGTQSNSW